MDLESLERILRVFAMEYGEFEMDSRKEGVTAEGREEISTENEWSDPWAVASA